MTTRRPRKPVPDVIMNMLVRSAEDSTLEVEVEGDILELRYRPMGWLAKSRCISEATSLSTEMNEETGQQELRAKLRLDIYNKLALKAMLKVDFPLSDQFFAAIPPSMGQQLETIIPNPYMNEEDLEHKKKESSESSPEIE